LKASAGIEAHTILADVKIVVTLRALCILRDASDVDVNLSSAKVASRDFAKRGHLGGTNFVFLNRSRTRSLLSFFVLVAALLVFSIH
jgi:hypothetical protein